MKITFVGAGSVRFSLRLVGDVIQTDEPSKPTEVCLMGINEERLNASFTLARKYAREMGSDVKIEKTMDSSRMIVGSGFVINTAYPYSPRYHPDGVESGM